MMIKRKLTLSLLAIILGFCLVLSFVLQAVVQPSFEQLELGEAGKDLDRVAQALQNEVDHLDRSAMDYGVWDDTYHFVEGKNEAYGEESVPPSTLDSQDLVLIQICDLDGRTLLDRRQAPPGFEDIELAALPPAGLPVQSTLRRTVETQTSVKGLLVTEWGPLFVSSQPVMLNDHGGQVVGTLVMARAFDSKHLEATRAETRVDFELKQPDGTALTLPDQDTDQAALPATASRFEPRGDDCLIGTRTLFDVSGRPARMIEATIPRSITARGNDAIRSAWISALVAGLVLLGVLYVMIERTIIGPLTHFTQRALTVRSRAQTVAELDLARKDEIGLLSQRFARMLEEIEVVQAQLSDASHKAGMSEVATNVLHNVGNLLNGVSVSSSLLRENLGQLPVDELSAVTGIVRAKGSDLARWVGEDPAGRRLPEFLERVSARLAQCKSTALGNCDGLGTGIGRVAALVRAQQDLAGGSGHIEPLVLADQIQAALNVISPDSQGIAVERSLDELPAISCDRHKLMQILVNLVKNSVEACSQPGHKEKRIRISARRQADRVVIEVADRGNGIAPEIRARIFEHGFTTKPDGHGFGLHSAANAAVEMKGRLCAESPGVGQGATFVLDLPLNYASASTPVQAREPKAPLRSDESLNAAAAAGRAPVSSIDRGAA